MAHLRTLIVDDTLFIRLMLRQLLDQTEFQVVAEAGDGDEAVAKYLEVRPDLVLMDIIMPHADGINAVQRIMAANPRALIVMCSALGQENIVAQARAAGARGYITKPFARDEVLRVLRSVAGAAAA